METYYIGIDIGGTTCRVSLGCVVDGTLEIIKKMDTYTTQSFTVTKMLENLRSDVNILRRELTIAAIGISCGGPLNSKDGLILSPPNLIGWDRVEIVKYFMDATGIPTRLCNDANAGALAEWMYGAGKGTDSMVFMTFGTGMGAGLILNGRLYEGASDMAGEIGHVRLAAEGPVGYGKRGSFEGFCSGGGIAQYAQSVLLAKRQQGLIIPWAQDIKAVSAKDVGLAANRGDSTALGIMDDIGKNLGIGLSMIIDILNPERIVIGSIYARNVNHLYEPSQAIIQEEALMYAADACTVVPSELGESIGDLASLTVASYFYEKELMHEK
ncbi:ROK family protein [Erysipelothrix sp. HDW6C]|uniref:ROK family protein n=1 Tax=Erysipelothrix sp. HDW6C TaxID=2714930 RepID=UPI00140E07D2|nr:ROK family protein [Erysipelothrix sp. HDW6C]QIK70651.1 ROK family protein [Erysipelothrix sp. HDW6C]